jgi:hypothetical protein
MATPGKKVTNQGAIAAAQAANAAAQANAAAAQARAAAADAARKPVLKQTVAGIGGINKATQAAMAVINNPKNINSQTVWLPRLIDEVAQALLVVLVLQDAYGVTQVHRESYS